MATITVLGATLKKDILVALDTGAVGLSLNGSMVEYQSLEIFKIQLDRMVGKLI